MSSTIARSTPRCWEPSRSVRSDACVRSGTETREGAVQPRAAHSPLSGWAGGLAPAALGAHARRSGAALLLAVWLAACGASPQPDDAAIVTDFQDHQSKVEVTADATVVRLLPDRTSATGIHEQFIIKLTSADLTLEVEHNISIAARAPVKEGDHVIVHGEYIWTAQGGLIHFTHHDPNGSHEGGYIQDGGTTYD